MNGKYLRFVTKIFLGVFLIYGLLFANEISLGVVSGFMNKNGFTNSTSRYNAVNGHRIVRGSNNTLHATYVDIIKLTNGNIQYQLIYARSNDNGNSWNTKVLETRNTGGYIVFPSIAVKGNDVYISCSTEEDTGVNNSIMLCVKSSDGGDTFQSVKVNNRGTGDIFFTDIIVDKNDRVHFVVTYLHGLSGASLAHSICYVYSDNKGNSWSDMDETSVRTTEPGSVMLSPYLSLDKNGEVYLSFHTKTEGLIVDSKMTGSLYKISSATPPILTKVFDIPHGGHQSRHVQVQHDSAGNLHLVYVHQPSKTADMQLRYRMYDSLGNLVGSEKTIVSKAELLSPQLAINHDDTPVIQYVYNAGVDFKVAQVYKKSADVFSTPVDVSDLSGAVFNSIVPNIQGDRPNVLWYNKNNKTVYYKHFEDKIAPLAPVAPSLEWTNKGPNSTDTQGAKATVTLPAGATHLLFDWDGLGTVDSSWQNGTTHILATGIHDSQTIRCRVKARDANGNESEYGPWATLVIGDRTPPNVSNSEIIWVNEADRNTNDTQQLQAKGKSVDNDAVNWQYRIEANGTNYYYNGTTWTTTAPAVKTNQSPSAVKLENVIDLQTVKLFVTGYDAAGNFSTSEVTKVISDRTPPTVTITQTPNPLYSETDDLPIGIGFNTTDVGDGVKNVKLFYTITNGGVTGPEKDSGLVINAPTGTFSFQPTVGNVKYNFILKAYDQQGNFGTNDTVTNIEVKESALGIPYFEFIEPNGVDDEVKNSLVIQWKDENPNDMTVKLYVVNAKNSTTPIMTIKTDISAAEKTNGYLWQIPDVNPLVYGQTYYVYGKLGNTIYKEAYSEAFVYKGKNPTENDPPAFLFTEPDGVDDVADQRFLLKWQDRDLDSNADITLYYDTDNQGFNGTMINNIPIKENDPLNAYFWNTSTLTPGDYYVYAVIQDGAATRKYYSYNPITIARNNRPAIVVYQPDGSQTPVNQHLGISWDYVSPRGTAQIRLYYDNDTDPANGRTPIETFSVSATNRQVSYLWKIPGTVALGDYYICAELNDGTEIVYDYSDVFNIDRSKNFPAFVFTEPDGVDDVANKSFTISWEDAGDLATAAGKIALYLDTDTVGYDGNSIIENIPINDPLNSYLWQIPATVADGTYYLYAKVTDDGQEFKVYSRFPITIKRTSGSGTALPGIPSIIVTQPNGNQAVKKELLINWKATDPENNATVTLYYDDNQNPLDGRTPIVGGLPLTQVAHQWTIPASLANGNYYICAEVIDSDGYVRYDYSDYAFELDKNVANAAPQFVFTEPDGRDDLAKKSFTISWLDNDPDDDATITLYYSDKYLAVPDPTKKIVDISENDEQDSYLWNTSALPAGKYYVSAVISDGINPAITVHNINPITILDTTQNDPPAIIVTQPSMFAEDGFGNYLIEWQDSDTDDDAQITLYYDTDTNPNNGKTLIVANLSENDPANKYDWNTTGVPEGTYYIYAEISDGNYLRSDYSGGTVFVSDRYSFVFTEPDGIDDVAKDAFTISWLDEYAGEDAKIELYYDADNSGFDGTLIKDDISEDDEVDGYLWDTRAIANGSYYIYAVMTGAARTIKVYSKYPITVNNSLPKSPPAILVVEPDGRDDYTVNGKFTVTWQDYSVPGDGSVITLYYDNDRDYTNGGRVLIATANPESLVDQYVWNMQNLSPTETYYICAEISNGTYTRYDYSTGAIRLDGSYVANNGGTGEGVYTFPNPFKPQKGGEVNIAFDVDEEGWTRIYLYNMIGDRVWQDDLYAYPDRQNILKWNGRDCFDRIAANGVYLIFVTNDKRKMIHKGRMTVLD